jgi:DNA-binding MarR family transcriptional regulator
LDRHDKAAGSTEAAARIASASVAFSSPSFSSMKRVRTIESHDMSRLPTRRLDPLDEAVRFEIKDEALVMLSFAANRLSSGAAPLLRAIADININEMRLIWFLGEGAFKTAAGAARMMGIDQAAISRSVQRLLDRKLVTSHADPEHAKRNILTLTDTGRCCAVAVRRFNKEREERLLSVLSPGERALLLEILSKIMGNIDAANSVQPDASWLAASQ